MSGPGREDRRLAWERRAEIPLLVAATVFLAAYAVPIVWPDLSPATDRTAELVIVGVWAVFGADYLVRLALAGERWRFVRTHLLDLALLVLPFLRPLRLLRLVFVLQVLHRRAQFTFRGRVVTYTVGAVAFVVLIASLAVLDAERRNPEANIQNMGDALWWALTTITTVGYGDHAPTTGEGRLAAALLMVAGIALLGVVTGSLASWFVERLRGVEQAEERTQAALAEILTEIRFLNARLDALERRPSPGD
ncbi:two pore domain potassium channel family protein [Actinomadura craniellae]|uniref:Two pore domain potassium channel family protein n=1 Tax=Actinomadura craniellae TaxID=2231787 RepID=A0A365GYE2_9ACTN|nr:potassium channel family protein [Actinomadura craniellae]RAY11860.1 two pore domain potassium channel family protein [Actinomadura craniellae]